MTVEKATGHILSYSDAFGIPGPPNATQPRITAEDAVALAMAEVRRRFNPGALVLTTALTSESPC
ncbi:MAG: hypothetical protein U0S12_01175 [Fimbriimonadales bacterium]